MSCAGLERLLRVRTTYSAAAGSGPDRRQQRGGAGAQTRPSTRCLRATLAPLPAKTHVTHAGWTRLAWIARGRYASVAWRRGYPLPLPPKSRDWVRLRLGHGPHHTVGWRFISAHRTPPRPAHSLHPFFQSSEPILREDRVIFNPTPRAAFVSAPPLGEASGAGRGGARHFSATILLQ